MEHPQEHLAKMYVEEYLREKGHTTKSLRSLPEEEAKRLMVEASTFAALKLTEVERKAQIVQELHGTSKPEG